MKKLNVLSSLRLFALAVVVALAFSSLAFADTISEQQQVNADTQTEIQADTPDTRTAKTEHSSVLSTQSVEAESGQDQAHPQSNKSRATSLFSENTDYYIILSANSNFVLDAAGSSPRKGSNVSAWTRNNGANQKWRFELGDDGYYTIVNAKNSSLVLDASGKNPRVGSNVSVWTRNNGLNQKWTVEKSGSSFIVRNAANPDLVLDASGKVPKRGANVTTWRSNDGANQRWSIKSQADIDADIEALAAAQKDTIKDGTYVIYASSLSGNPVLDVKSASKDNNANIQTASSNGSANQAWVITHAGNYVLIKNQNSGKYLSVASNNSLSGANVVQTSDSSARGAKWIFVRNSNGTYAIKSALFSDISLDITGAKATAGTNVEIWATNNGNAQTFSLANANPNVGASDAGLDLSGYYFIKSFSNGGLQLDVTGASTSNNANIELWNRAKQPWQIFSFEKEGDYYRIIDAHSNKVLTTASNSLIPGVNVVIYAKNTGSNNQLWQIKKNADNSYSFINKRNGFALQVSSGTQKAGTNVNTAGYSASNNNQKFNLEKLNYVMPTGIYNLKTALNSNQLLDVTGGKTEAGVNIEIWGNNSGQAQKWNIQEVSGQPNVYTLQALCSAKYLADNGSGNAVQVDSGTAANSMWRATIYAGSYVLTNVGTGKTLEVAGSKNAAGTNVGTAACTNANNQRWNLASTPPLQNGTYIIRSKANTSQVLDVVGNSMANNANVDMWTYNKGLNQKFNFFRNSDGTYAIINCGSGKALDAAGGKSSAGTNIAQYTRHNNANQKWKVEFVSDGSFRLVSAVNSNVVIGFSGSAPSNGANVSLVQRDDNSNAQRFVLEATTAFSQDQINMMNKAQGYTSGTGNLILVNLTTHKVGVFSGSKGNWNCIQYWSVATGAPWSKTITGVYRTTGYKKPQLSTDPRAKYGTQINGEYFFHTIVESESELGKSVSHGCIRMSYPSAQWIYNNIKAGTTVALYY